MAKNEGKKFEDDFKQSCEKVENFFIMRLVDGTASWSSEKSDNVRFQAKNICDFVLSYQGKLVLLELKSILKSSLPFGNIKNSQTEGLTKAFNKNATHMFIGFLVNFRDHEETYFMSIEQFNQYVTEVDRKSIPIDFFRNNCILVEQKKKKVRYNYNIEKFMGSLK